MQHRRRWGMRRMMYAWVVLVPVIPALRRMKMKMVIRIWVPVTVPEGNVMLVRWKMLHPLTGVRRRMDATVQLRQITKFVAKILHLLLIGIHEQLLVFRYLLRVIGIVSAVHRGRFGKIAVCIGLERCLRL